MNLIARCAPLVILPLLVNCGTRLDSTPPSLSAAQQKIKNSPQPAVLFVGNSFSQNVPPEFARIAAAHGTPVRTDKATANGWTLARHALCPETLHKIRSGKWDVVVLQEQSRMPARSIWIRRVKMRPALAQLAHEARSAGAVPLLMQTWGYSKGDPSRARDDFHKMTARLRKGTHEEAAHAKLPVIPVGDAWQREVEQGRSQALFHADGWHPSTTGNKTTARTLYEMLFPNPRSQRPDPDHNLARLPGPAVQCL
jgi:hypothetical protein